MPHKTLRFRLVTVLILIMLPSFVGVSLLNYFIQRDAIREEVIHTSLPLVRDLINWEISTRLREPLLAASMMANDTFLMEWVTSGEKDLKKIQDYLEVIKNEHNFAASFFVSANTYKYYSYIGLNKTISPFDEHDIWYYQFVDSQLKVDLDVDVDEVSGALHMVFINHRLESRDGELLGVTGVGLDMSDIAGLLQETQTKYGKRIYLVDETGTIQAHSNYDLIEKASIKTMEGIKEIADTILQSHSDSIDLEYTGNNGKVLLTSRYIKGVSWYIIVEQDEKDSLRLIVRNLFRTILIGLAASLLIVFVSIYFVNMYQRKLENISVTDHLTGITNRMHLDAVLEQEFVRARRYETSFSVLLMDLDWFKIINDTKGHAVGDSVLKELVRVISGSIRESDIFGRWGGDEFLILLPQTELGNAGLLAEKLRIKIEEYLFKSIDAITISIGAASLLPADTVETLLKRADEALYEAKNNGRNRVVLSS
ncbi:MAG: GGDEF domain-containing protein [Spirochaetia bacterium]|nr:GGDEF domain-containing protein [Spirochaetia bacterium]